MVAFISLHNIPFLRPQSSGLGQKIKVKRDGWFVKANYFYIF